MIQLLRLISTKFFLSITIYFLGVLFKMMSTDLRKKSPETIDELKKMNFSVVDYSLTYIHPYTNLSVIENGPYILLEDERRLEF